MKFWKDQNTFSSCSKNGDSFFEAQFLPKNIFWEWASKITCNFGRGAAFEETEHLNSKLEKAVTFEFKEHTIFNFKISDFQKYIFGARCTKNIFWYKIDFL